MKLPPSRSAETVQVSARLSFSRFKPCTSNSKILNLHLPVLIPYFDEILCIACFFSHRNLALGGQEQGFASEYATLQELAWPACAEAAAGRHPDFGALPFPQGQEPYSRHWRCEL